MFDIHAPIKKRYIRANQGSFMNKALQRAVVTRSRLRNKCLKKKLSLANLHIKSKEILCQAFSKGKKSFFENLDTKNISDNKKFWKI